VGRNLTDRDRSPAFSRIKAIFAERLMQINGKRPLLPAPEWSHQKNAARGR
jgi:hypothetical protein